MHTPIYVRARIHICSTHTEPYGHIRRHRPCAERTAGVVERVERETGGCGGRGSEEWERMGRGSQRGWHTNNRATSSLWLTLSLPRRNRPPESLSTHSRTSNQPARRPSRTPTPTPVHPYLHSRDRPIATHSTTHRPTNRPTARSHP